MKRECWRAFVNSPLKLSSSKDLPKSSLVDPSQSDFLLELPLTLAPWFIFAKIEKALAPGKHKITKYI